MIIKAIPKTAEWLYLFGGSFAVAFAANEPSFCYFFILAIFSNESELAVPNPSIPQLIDYFYCMYKYKSVDISDAFCYTIIKR